MYNALPQKYNYNRQKTIGISTGINIIIALILVKTHGRILFNHANTSAPKPSVISIQQYKIITQNNTPAEKPTENTQATQEEQKPEVLEEIKPQPKEKPSKNVVKELKKDNKPPQESQQKTQKQQTPSAQNSETPKETTQEDITPVTEATYFGMNNTPPKYPIISFQLGEYGNVVIEYTISKEGTVKEARIMESSGFLRLDRVALMEFKKWKFKPATNLTGTPVDSRKKIITFAFDIKTQEIKAD